MKIYIRDRRSGKTTDLIKESNEKWLYIVCANHLRAEYINRLAMKLDIDIPHPITVSELPIRSPFIDKVLIDDVEDVLECIIGKQVETCTTSCEVDMLLK